MNMDFKENKNHFYFSQQQKDEQIERYLNAPKELYFFQMCDPTKPSYAVLDDGRVEEYTESRTDLEYKIVPIKPHAERFSDSIYLGTGELAFIDSFINKLEKQLRHEGESW